MTRLDRFLVLLCAAVIERTAWRGLHVYARQGRVYVSCEPPEPVGVPHAR